MNTIKLLKIQSIFFLLIFLLSCSNENVIKTGNLQFNINNEMQTKISLAQPSGNPLMSGYSNSEYLLSGLQKINDFKLESVKNSTTNTAVGLGEMYEFKGLYKEGDVSVRKTLRVRMFNNFPGMLTTKVTYENIGKRNIPVRFLDK